MKSICLCIKIHIPVIPQKFQFFKINNNADYYDSGKTREHVKYLVRNNLLPFLDAVQNLSHQFGNRFKIALSISGISIMLLEKYAPQIIDEFKELSQNGCIDFLAEPWSHSLLPFFDEKTLQLQTDLHQKTIQSVFGKTPSVFIVNSTVYSEFFFDFTPFPGCKTIFAYSNGSPDNRWQRENEKTKPNQQTYFFINQNLSQKLQNCLLAPIQKNEADVVPKFTRFIRKHSSLAMPLIVVYNPLLKSLWFDGVNSRRWQIILTLLLNNTSGSFYSPNDLVKTSNYFNINNEFSEELRMQFKLPNLWLKNELQKEAFKHLHLINTLIREFDQSSLTDSWNLIQDMDNLYYIGNQFFSEKYAQKNFSPFQSPYQAFMNYMNILDDYQNRIKESNNIFSKNYSLANNSIE